MNIKHPKVPFYQFTFHEVKLILSKKHQKQNSFWGKVRIFCAPDYTGTSFDLSRRYPYKESISHKSKVAIFPAIASICDTETLWPPASRSYRDFGRK